MSDVELINRVYTRHLLIDLISSIEKADLLSSHSKPFTELAALARENLTSAEKSESHEEAVLYQRTYWEGRPTEVGPNLDRLENIKLVNRLDLYGEVSFLCTKALDGNRRAIFLQGGNEHRPTQFVALQDVILIESIDEYDAIVKQSTNSSTYLRGQANPFWKLSPKIHRYVESIQLPWRAGPMYDFGQEYKRNAAEEFERSTLAKFRKLASAAGVRRPANDWEWLAFGRHCGLNTRLLDWTDNPLTALFFATTSEATSCGGTIHVYSPTGTEIDPQLEDPFNPLVADRMVRLPEVHDRMRFQSGLFSVHTWHLYNDFEMSEINHKTQALYIPPSALGAFRDLLAKEGVTRGRLFGDLDSLAHDVNVDVSPDQQLGLCFS